MRRPSPTAKTAEWLRERAAGMRASPTWSEALLWNRLRAMQLGAEFRRQVLVGGRFIADFLAPAARLIVEVDGSVHQRRAGRDRRRDRVLRRLGYRVLRLEAELVARDLELAVARVEAALRA